MCANLGVEVDVEASEGLPSLGVHFILKITEELFEGVHAGA